MKGGLRAWLCLRDRELERLRFWNLFNVHAMSTEHHDPAPLEDGEITEDDTVVAHLSPPKSPIQKPCRFAQITHHPHSNKKNIMAQ